MHCAGDVAAVLVLTGVFAGMLRARAHVPDHGIFAGDRVSHLVQAAEPVAARAHLELRALDMRLFRRDRPSFREPLLEATVEYSRACVSVMVERPPEARRIED